MQKRLTRLRTRTDFLSNYVSKRELREADLFWSALVGAPVPAELDPSLARAFEVYDDDFALDSARLTPAGGASIETTPAPVKVTHFHVRKFLDPSARALLSDPAPGPMDPARMKPGYVAVAGPARQSLQTALTKLVQDKYAAAIAPSLHFRLALVDLTEAKHHAPVFAGFSAFNGIAGVEGGSLVKILALYALFQLRFDLNTFARLQNIASAATLQTEISKQWATEGFTAVPALNSIFRFVVKAGSPVVADITIDTKIHHNHVARAMILALGFEYIGSVALQSGLFDETQGGLWLNAAYSKPKVTWTTSPFPKLERHHVTALSAATFFTLLAQGRLADQPTSNEIAAVLTRVKCMDAGLLDGINTLPGIAQPSANKCGILTRVFHEAIHVQRQVPSGRKLEYVVALLTQEPPVLDFPTLGIQLDGLIAAANP